MHTLRLLSIAALALALPAVAQEDVGEGQPAPSFALKTLNPEVAGTTWLALDRFVGEDPDDPDARVVLLSFFASWCGPCQREMPYLQQLHQMYASQGLRVIGVDVDREEPGMIAAKKMLEKNRVTYPVLSDRFNFLARRYLGEQAPLPSVFLVRRDGTIAKIERGYTKEATAFLLADVQAALGIKRAAQAAIKPPGARR